jgi:hypothetical protein
MRSLSDGDAHFDRVRFGSALVQFRNMLAAPLAPLLPAVENGGEDDFQPLRLEQAVLEMAGHQIVRLSRKMAAAAPTQGPGLPRCAK